MTEIQDITGSVGVVVFPVQSGLVSQGRIPGRHFSRVQEREAFVADLRSAREGNHSTTAKRPRYSPRGGQARAATRPDVLLEDHGMVRWQRHDKL